MQVSDMLCKLIGQWHVPDVEQRSHAEDVVTPLVVAVNQGTDKTSDNHNDGHEQRGHDVGERKASSEQELKEQQREGDKPLDVPHIPDLACVCVTARPLGYDGSYSKGSESCCTEYK